MFALFLSLSLLVEMSRNETERGQSGRARRKPRLSSMRIPTILLVSVLVLVLVSCGGSDSTELSEAESTWCADPANDATFNAIWDAADELDVDSIGNFMLERADITTDVDPKNLQADDLTESELEALTAVGEEFETSDAMWLEYLETDNGAAACAAAYEAANG